MIKRIPTSPFDVVAKALKADRDSVTEDSSLNVHPKWDSINHLDIILAMEEEYGIVIGNDEVLKYTTMKAIIEKYEDLVNQQEDNS